MAKKPDKTSNFIDVLTQDLNPVKTLPSSKKLTAIWVLFAIAIVTFMVFLHGLRLDVHEKVHDIGFLVESSILIILALLIAYAGFRIGVPDTSNRQKLWVSLIYGGLIFWIVMFGFDIYHSLESVAHHTQSQSQPHSLSLSHSHAGKICSSTIIASALAAAGVMFFMLRRSFTVRPILTGLAVGLTSSTIAYIGGMYFCSIEGGMHIALWHMLPVLFVSLMLSVIGQFFLNK